MNNGSEGKKPDAAGQAVSPSCPDLTLPTPLLSGLCGPDQLAGMDAAQTAQLAEEIRRVIINTVSHTGGHLAPSLGVVELTLALLSSFDVRRDRLVWDVGHQTYAYKLLTGRLDRFGSLRQHGGLCGFPSREESAFDHFGVGHSSTSISAALGMAVARDLAGENHHVLAVIGDGSMTAGLAYEGLNQAGATGKKLIVVLNDNEMSISRNVGALSFFLSRNLSSPLIRQAKREIEELLGSIPSIGPDIASIIRKGQHSLKGFLTPGMLFEAFRFNYMGPVDGHDIKAMNKAFEVAKQVDKPVLVHVLTVKGKGYAPAEENPVHFHGVGRFSPETGLDEPCTPAPPTYTAVFGQTLCAMAEKDDRVVAITAAMPEGTGLGEFADRFADRFVDVGICEQHAVTFAAGLAVEGRRPYVAIYSTFLQRSYDQIVHDVCIQNLPVCFCVDRAGLVGEDGATHQGVFDIAYLRHIPNMAVIAPRDAHELRRALEYSLVHDGPLAIRYPRGRTVAIDAASGMREPDRSDAAGKVSALASSAGCHDRPYPVGRIETMRQGDNAFAILALGNTVLPALEAARILESEDSISVTVCDARWVKPLPEDDILSLARSHDGVLTVEEAVTSGGYGSAVLELCASHGLAGNVHVHGLPDAFIEHGAAAVLRARYGLDAQGIATAVRQKLFKRSKSG